MENFQEISIQQFEKLFRGHYEELCAYANHIVKDLEESEEIVQSLFVKLWENRASTKIEKSIRSYLYSAVKNACFNQQKHLKIKETYKEHNKRELDSQNVSVEEEIEANELDIKIKAAIDKLPEGRKQIFILSRYDGLKYKEIAEKLKISVKTVENQMSSAIKSLKIELAEFVTVLGLIIFLGQDLF